MTIGDVTEWCLKQQPRAFKNWTEQQLLMTIREHVENNTICLALDNGDIKGLVLYKRIPEKKEYYIEEIVTSAPKMIFQLFVSGLVRENTDFTGWKITGRRHGVRQASFNIDENLINRLKNI